MGGWVEREVGESDVNMDGNRGKYEALGSSDERREKSQRGWDCTKEGNIIFLLPIMQAWDIRETTKGGDAGEDGIGLSSSTWALLSF